MKVFNNFKIIRYLNPTWYFNLQPDAEKNFSTCIFNSRYKNSFKGLDKSLKEDSDYSSTTAAELDAGYNLWNRGYLIYNNGTKSSLLNHENKISAIDEYIFARKYYSKKFVIYLLLRSIAGLTNPFKEIKSFFKTRNISKSDTIRMKAVYESFNDFKSELVSSNPLVSIIIPTLNRYEYLKDVLTDLEKQEYKNFEVVITDQTDTPDTAFYKKFSLNLNAVFQNEKGQWYARNEAIKICKGTLLLFFDDDSRVEPDWITNHLKCLDYFNADISAGVSISVTGDKVPENYGYFRWADQFDSGNALVKKEVFIKAGMFDRQFDGQRMGDGEFGLRAYLSGFRSISNPYAKRVHLKVGTGGLRQMGSWDAFRPKNFFAPRPVPSVLYFFRKYFPTKNVIDALIIRLLPSLIPYKWKGKKILYPLLIPAAIIFFPAILIQLAISWSKSTAMLRQGDKIEKLV